MARGAPQHNEPRLRIVAGKGGVGKTVTATALALAHARVGRKVLVAEVHAGDRVTSLLGAQPVGPEMREVLENLYVVDMDPRHSIREYAMLNLHFETVYKAVFENRLVRYFIRLVPSLGELTMLGKLWFHSEEMTEDGRPRFDLIVLDAPATGHAISLLRAPRAVEQTVPAGPFKDNCTKLRELLMDHERTVMHIVTTPEEMPVNEAVELEQAASEVLGIRLGKTVVNHRTAKLPEGCMAALGPLGDDPGFEDVYRALCIREGKVDAGEEHLGRLPGRMLGNSISFPSLVDAEFDLGSLEKLADVIDASWP